MTDPYRNIAAAFERKAETDSGYAIAFAVLSLARETRTLQEHLTFTGPGHHPGVLEKIGIELTEIARAATVAADRIPTD